MGHIHQNGASTTFRTRCNTSTLGVFGIHFTQIMQLGVDTLIDYFSFWSAAVAIVVVPALFGCTENVCCIRTGAKQIGVCS